MPCELRIRHDLSLNDIIRLTRDHYVKVTPHVGNWTPARLVLPSLNLTILCVDHTIGSKDKNAHPHLLIEHESATPLCEESDRLTTHSKVTRNVHATHKVGSTLSEVHVGSLRSLFPNADIVTHCEHLEKHREITLTVLEEVTKLSRSQTWWRKVNDDGMVAHFRSKDLPREWRDYAQHIFPLTNKREGWLIHNRVSILMDVILQSRMGTEAEIYHLSGPDMVRYLGHEMETISRMYDHVRARLHLPQSTITVNLVPFASFRFATRDTQAHACERLCEHLAETNPISDRVRSYAREAFDVLAESETKQHLSQHDCLRDELSIVVPEIVRNWPMAQCAEKLAQVRACT